MKTIAARTIQSVAYVIASFNLRHFKHFSSNLQCRSITKSAIQDKTSSKHCVIFSFQMIDHASCDIPYRKVYIILGNSLKKDFRMRLASEVNKLDQKFDSDCKI